jgi:hypothetical protein
MNKSFLAMIAGGLLLLFQNFNPSPAPTPDPEPILPSQQDLWGKSAEVHRVLVSEVLADMAFSEFANDADKLKHIQTEMSLAYKSAYPEVNKRIQVAVETGSEAVRALSEDLKDRKLE